MNSGTGPSSRDYTCAGISSPSSVLRAGFPLARLLRPDAIPRTNAVCGDARIGEGTRTLKVPTARVPRGAGQVSGGFARGLRRRPLYNRTCPLVPPATSHTKAGEYVVRGSPSFRTTSQAS